MNDRALRFLLGVATAAAVLVSPLAARADVELADVNWQTVGGTGMVQFHLRWHNPDPALPSLAVSGQVFAQEFGVFLPNQGLIGHFDVPPIEPESFFDVFLEVPFSSLPLPPEEGYLSKLLPGLPAIPCPPGNHWDGNIDILWAGPVAMGT